jgi:hypothetical protein
MSPHGDIIKVARQENLRFDVVSDILAPLRFASVGRQFLLMKWDEMGCTGHEFLRLHRQATSRVESAWFVCHPTPVYPPVVEIGGQAQQKISSA